ncbi:hypothetical protein GCM10023260_12900 [Bartonella acomydis]|uniref:Uncharacterized protein n=1 Tax=Bartonella acomydis TaxID=686234 RepID=A0ABP9MSS7_9HYPH
MAVALERRDAVKFYENKNCFEQSRIEKNSTLLYRQRKGENVKRNEQ